MIEVDSNGTDKGYVISVKWVPKLPDSHTAISVFQRAIGTKSPEAAATEKVGRPRPLPKGDPGRPYISKSAPMACKAKCPPAYNPGPS